MLLVAFIGFILTTILTWPFLSNINGFYRVRGDYPLEGWKLWYNFFSISTGRIFHQADYFNSNQFYFYPFSFAYSDNVFVPGIIFSIIYVFSKNLILSVNSYTFLTFILTFISAFYVLRYFVKNSYASAVGAVIFTFNPLTFAHFPGHIQLMNKFFLPPLLFFGYKFFTKISLKDALLFFLFFTLNSLSSAYFFIFSLIFIPLIFIPIIVKNLIRQKKDYLFKLVKYLPIGIFFLPIIIYFNYPYLEFSGKEMVTRSLAANWASSANLIDWVTPHPKNILYNNLFEYLDNVRQVKNLSYAEKVLFLNIIPVILFTLGLWQILKKSKNFFFFLIYLILSTGLLTFGPFFSISYKSDNLVTLPYLYLYEYLPFLQGIRAPSRFQFIFYIIFTLVATYGVTLLLKRFKKRRMISLVISLFLVILICLENLNSYSGDLNLKSPTYIQFKQLSGKVAFLKNKVTFHLPVYTPYDQDVEDGLAYLIWLPQTQENMLNGFSGYFPNDWNKLMIKFKEGINKDNIKTAKALGVQYLVIHKDMLNKNFKMDVTNIGKSTVFEDQNIRIINLDKIDVTTHFCSLDKDFNIVQVRYKDDNDVIGLALQNKNDCYLVNKYQDRYFEFNILVDSKERKVRLKLPLIIEPKETIILSKLTNDLELN